MKKVLILFAFLTFISMQMFAQRTVTGTVTGADDGMGLPGVSVAVKGTSLGTVTDINGKYSLDVPAEAKTLVFSFMGMKTQEVQVTGDVVNAALESQDQVIDDVIVTALGVTREKKSLGYSVQEIDGEAVNKVRETNFVNSLSGKIAGVHVKQSNTMGGSANVIIRGSTSLTGNNQALFVIDGVPVDNTINNGSGQAQGSGGYDFGNAASDINPDDIESISVLKGAAATVLYGSRASNGVILITTKKGKKGKGIGVTVNSGFVMSKIDVSTMPEHQNEYGAGYGPYYSASDIPQMAYADLDGDGIDDYIVPTSEDASWGAKFDPNLMVFHWDAMIPGEDGYLKKRPWVAGANGIEYFFQTGMKWTNNIAVDGGTDKGSYRLSYTNVDETGILPNSKIEKNTINFSADYKLTEKLTVAANVNYINSGALGRYGTGYDGQNVMQSFGQWYETNIDMARLENYETSTGMHRTWNWAGPTDLRAMFFDNPYWVRYKSYEDDSRNRVFGYTKINYKIADWIEFVGRVSTDYYTEYQNERIAVQSNSQSKYSKYVRTLNENNVDLMFKINKDFSESFSLNALLGANIRRNTIKSTSASTAGGLIVPELYAVSNSVSPVANSESLVERGMNSAFANVSLGYANMIYVDLAARVDKSSTLPTDNNTYFYPSISTSFIFTELGALKSSTVLSFGKIRLNFAQVGSDAPAYQLASTYSQGTNWSDLPLFSVNSTLRNPDLKPEQTQSLEAGLEMKFLNNRVGFDISLYKTNTLDQIMPVTVSNASGYYYRYVNAGEIENKGIELAVNATPVSTGVFTWNVNVNWFANRNMVVSLAEGIDNYYMGGLWDVSINAAVGEPYGTIKGTDFIYIDPNDRESSKVVDADGYYLESEEGDLVLGNVNPDWNMGISNSVTYKNFSLSALIDIQKGGDIYSLNTKYGRATGVYSETVGNNDKGNPMRDHVDDGGGMRYPNTVYEDGSENTSYVRASHWGGYWYYGNTPTAAYVFDASYIKLRELSLTYALPKSIIGKTPFTNISLSLVGRNLAILFDNVKHFDPETGQSAGNVQGLESGAYPTARTFGFNLKLVL